MATEIQLENETRKSAELNASRRRNDLKLLRRLARGFIWLGVVACGAHLLLAVPSVSSFTHLLVIVIETIGRLSATVGLGAVLLALAEIADSIRVPGHFCDQQRTPASEGFRGNS
jgi:hypothetical protein